jgi:hypothetical protein
VCPGAGDVHALRSTPGKSRAVSEHPARVTAEEPAAFVAAEEPAAFVAATFTTTSLSAITTASIAIAVAVATPCPSTTIFFATTTFLAFLHYQASS